MSTDKMGVLVILRYTLSMHNKTYQKLIDTLNLAIEPLVPGENNFSSICRKVGDARFVLIGEATHGTQEFYQTRIAITKQLIEEKGFMAVAIEGDWPDAYKVHRYLQGDGPKTGAKNALSGFNRFPSWMWRNTTMPPFLRWLRNHNDKLDAAEKIGFYGLDLYSLNSSMQAVIQYLSKVDKQAAQRAKERYACFDHMGIDPQDYGFLTNIGLKENCADEAVSQLLELQHNAFTYLQKEGIAAEDEYFFATQNARIVKNAENYYRTMFEEWASSWNVRDTHMADTVNVLADTLEQRFQKPAKIIIWAHNSHVGDARATEARDNGEINVGQLIREQHSTSTYSIGFSTYEGYVRAASHWDGQDKRKKVVPGMQGSYEALFHDLQYKNFLLDLAGNPQLEHFLSIPRLQRAIGVIYAAETERASHYFFTHLLQQFDTIVHFDKTSALKRLGWL